MAKNVPIKETHELPSLGKIYGDNFPSTVTLRAMTTLDEKTRLAGNGGLISIANLIQNCVLEPKDLKVVI